MADEPTKEQETFLREVDDELRRSQLLSFWDRWKVAIIGGVGGGLALLAGGIWWSGQNKQAAAESGEYFDKGLVAASENRTADANKELAPLATGNAEGYRGSALMAQAAMTLQGKDTKRAVELYDQISKDDALSSAWRDAAIIRKTHAEFDSMKPQDVISRLAPLAVKGAPYYGHAAEATALAYLKMGKKAEAGKIFGEIYKDESVPKSLRSRAVKMAGILGVDVVDTSDIDAPN